MAKRIFEDPDKYDDPWHIELPAEGKLLLDYLYCSCNRAGFLKWSESIAAFKTGIPQERIGAMLDLLINTPDITGHKVIFRNGIIYLHAHIFIQDPNGLSITNTAHGGILKSMFSQIDTFPECLVHFPDSHSAMKKTIEDYIEQGSAKNKEAAMRSLLKALNRVTPSKLKAAPQEQMELFKNDVPALVKECLRRLAAVPGYPFDYKTDCALLVDMLQDYGEKGFLFALKGKISWWLDEPIKKSSKPRSQLRNWFHNQFVIFPEKELTKKQEELAVGKKKLRQQKEQIKKETEERKKKEAEEAEKIKKENVWLDEHLEEKDIPAVMKKMETDDRKLIVEFMNQRRQAKGLKPIKEKG